MSCCWPLGLGASRILANYVRLSHSIDAKPSVASLVEKRRVVRTARGNNQPSCVLPLKTGKPGRLHAAISAGQLSGAEAVAQAEERRYVDAGRLCGNPASPCVDGRGGLTSLLPCP